MKKNKPLRKLTPEEAIGFLEDFRLMQAGQDRKSKAISIRVPENILDAYRTIALSEKRSYQAMMIEALREYLRTIGHR